MAGNECFGFFTPRLEIELPSPSIEFTSKLLILWFLRDLPNFHTFYFVHAMHAITHNWTVQRQTTYGFSSIAYDQTIEQTFNRKSKTKGGMVGISLNRPALKRWILSQPQRVSITEQCKKMAGMEKATRLIRSFLTYDV